MRLLLAAQWQDSANWICEVNRLLAKTESYARLERRGTDDWSEDANESFQL
ncbi:MAG: hypothetical protein JWR21_2121 [Herminiimonas sp.]|nr:hypothetical protein [Herminiimonas sp.]MDB5854330.1 hypothetical protein [Herminiimonas sp.]